MTRMFGRVSQKAVTDMIEDGAFDFEGMNRDYLSGICRDFFEGGGQLGFFTQKPIRPPQHRKKRETPGQLSFFEQDGDE